MRWDILKEDSLWERINLDTLVKQVVDALSLQEDTREVCFVFANDSFIHELNKRYRRKDSPTNVLAFPQHTMLGHIGDIVIAYETVHQEALDQGKDFMHHLAHMLIHGLLHLLGYTHEEEEDARVMQALETQVLAKLSLPCPYTK